MQTKSAVLEIHNPTTRLDRLTLDTRNLSIRLALVMSLTHYHPRQFGNWQYVYPVISRRSGGLSLGINLSPTALCNFACVYCQILAEESKPKTDSAQISLEQLRTELRQLVESVNNDTLFEQTWLTPTLPEQRVLKDIAFSGDGEPTLSSQFAEAVRLAADVRKELCSESVKIVLITNATTLHLPFVRSALDLLLQNNGEVWAKLDAGTSDYFKMVSRSSIPFQTIRTNLIDFSRNFPVVVQTCFLALHGKAPSDDEIQRYAECLTELDKVQYVQIYTSARSTPEPWVRPLENSQIDDIAERVRQLTRFDVQTFYGH